MSAILARATKHQFALVAQLANGRIAEAYGPLETLPILPLLRVLAVTLGDAPVQPTPSQLCVVRLSAHRYRLAAYWEGVYATDGDCGLIARELQRIARDELVERRHKNLF